jgi:hypothetical protein
VYVKFLLLVDNGTECLQWLNISRNQTLSREISMLKATANVTRRRFQTGHRRRKRGRKRDLVRFSPLDRSQRACVLAFRSFCLTETTNSPAGGHSFSIVAQTKSPSLRSDHKVSTLVQNTSARIRQRWLPHPAPQRAYTFWQIWCGILRCEVFRGTEIPNY